MHEAIGSIPFLSGEQGRESGGWKGGAIKPCLEHVQAAGTQRRRQGKVHSLGACSVVVTLAGEPPSPQPLQKPDVMSTERA